MYLDAANYDYTVKGRSCAEMYHAMGLGEIGHLLSCARGSHFLAGYDPRIHLTRPAKIMPGGGRCDFDTVSRTRQREMNPMGDAINGMIALRTNGATLWDSL